MFIKANFHKFTAALLSLAIVIVCIMLLIFSKECADGAFSGIEMCINVLIPFLCFRLWQFHRLRLKSGISDFLWQTFRQNYEIGIRTKSMLCTHITAFGYGRLSYRCKKL